jgi:hypothetical protein
MEVPMAIQAHLAELERKHEALENQLHEALNHPSTDDITIVEIKRRKLQVKDEIEFYGLLRSRRALHRADLTRAPVPACDAALATLVAGLATAQVVGFLDGHDVATMDATVEATLPSALPRRRSWQPHPACGCTWSQADDAVGTAAMSCG